MFHLYDPHQVTQSLGQKVLDGLGSAVAATRRDLREYRQLRPLWVAQQTERGLKNWLHDRLFHHARHELEDLPDVTFLDREPHRDIFVGVRFHLRLKAHSEADLVAAYPTQESLDFMVQGPQLSFPLLEEVRLIGGYRWNRELRSVGPAVLTLRDGRTRVLWAVELRGRTDDAGQDHFQPYDLPPLPTISAAGSGDEEGTAEW